MLDPSQMMGAGGGPAAPQGGPPPTLAIPAQGGGQDDDTSAQGLIDKAAGLLHKALAMENDPEDKALISNILATVHKIGAAHQKEKDAAIGVSPALKHVRRQSGSGY